MFQNQKTSINDFRALDVLFDFMRLFCFKNHKMTRKNTFQVGNTLTSLFEDFLVRLEVRCDVISSESGAGNLLKLSLLKLLTRLLEPDAPLARGQGPLDIQKAFLSVLLSMHYNGLHNTPTCVTIVSDIGICFKHLLFLLHSTHVFISIIKSFCDKHWNECLTFLEIWKNQIGIMYLYW